MKQLINNIVNSRIFLNAVLIVIILLIAMFVIVACSLLYSLYVSGAYIAFALCCLGIFLWAMIKLDEVLNNG